MSSTINYTTIEPYLVKATVQGDNLHCTIRIEEKTFEIEAPILPVDSGRAALGALVKNPSRVGSFLGRVFRRAFAKPVEAEEGEQETNEEGEPTTKVKSKRRYSSLEIEAAAVRAFEQILDQIIYVETTDKWHLVSNFSAFEAFIRQNPLKETMDKRMMSRMLVEMARMDGRISERERLFIDQFVNIESARLATLMQAPKLKADDVEQVSEAGRPTVFLVVAAGALSDDRLQGEEERRLFQFADWFGFDVAQRQRLLDMAQDYTLELAIRARFHRLRPEGLRQLAEHTGVSFEVAQQVYDRIKVAREA